MWSTSNDKRRERRTRDGRMKRALTIIINFLVRIFCEERLYIIYQPVDEEKFYDLRCALVGSIDGYTYALNDHWQVYMEFEERTRKRAERVYDFHCKAMYRMLVGDKQ